MMASVKTDMTEGAGWKKILVFSIPIMLGNLLQQMYNTIDGIIVGRMVDSDALAAVGNCATVSALLIAVAMGFSAGCSIIIAHYMGAKREDELKATFATGLILVIALSIVFMAVGIVGHHWLLGVVLNIKDEVILEYAKGYLIVYCIGLIFTYCYNYIAYILRAMGDSRATLYFLAVASVMNLLLDMIFVRRMGVVGAAWATVVSQCVCFLFSYHYMSKHYAIFAFKNLPFRPDREKVGQCITLGLPSVMQQCSVSLGQGAMQRLVNSYGGVTMAAYTVGSMMERYCTVPILAVQQGMSTFTGQNMGAGREGRVKKTLWHTEIMILILTSIVSIPIAVFAPRFAALFGVSGEILNQAVEYVRFAMPWCTWIFAAYLACAGVLQGAGDVKFTTFISLSSLAVRAIVAYIMAGCFHAEYPIIWQSLLISYVWSIVFAWIRYFSGVWKKKSEAIMK